MIIPVFTLFFFNVLIIFLSNYKFALLSSMIFTLIYAKIKKQNIYNYLIATLFVLALFDNLNFTFDYGVIRGIRPQTLPAILCTIAFCISYVCGLHINKYLTFFILYALGLTIFFGCFSDQLGILYSIKYWLLYWFPAIWIYIQTSKLNNKFIPHFLTLILLFVSIYGILQIVFNFTLPVYIRQKFQFDWWNVSPAAFFSERTWYGTVCAFCLPMILYHLEINKITKKEFVFFLFILTIGILISLSRNAYVGFTIWVLASFVLSKHRYFIIKSFSIILFINICISAILIVFIPQLLSFILVFTQKLQLTQDGSGAGRIEALFKTSERYFNEPMRLLGTGFNWQETETSLTGTAYGSKSANFFEFILSIFGLHSLIILISSLFIYFINKQKYFSVSPECRNGFILLTMWLIMAQFAPLHQNGITLFICAFSFGLISKGDAILKFQNQRLVIYER